MTGCFGYIEKETEKNTCFRKVLFTGKHLQLVLMSLLVGEEISNEVHPNVDQFFRIESGKAKFVLNNTETYTIGPGDDAVISSGTWHNVINAAKTEPLKLYTVYTPPNHPDGTIHKTGADTEKAELADHY